MSEIVSLDDFEMHSEDLALAIELLMEADQEEYLSEVYLSKAREAEEMLKALDSSSPYVMKILTPLSLFLEAVSPELVASGGFGTPRSDDISNEQQRLQRAAGLAQRVFPKDNVFKSVSLRTAEEAAALEPTSE